MIGFAVALMGFLLYQGVAGLVRAETLIIGRMGSYYYTGFPARLLALSYLSLFVSGLSFLGGRILKPRTGNYLPVLSVASLGLTAILLPIAIILEAW